MKEFETHFCDFLDSDEYEAAESAVFDLGRRAFIAGWLAAGGELPQVIPLRNARYLSRSAENFVKYVTEQEY